MQRCSISNLTKCSKVEGEPFVFQRSKKCKHEKDNKLFEAWDVLLLPNSEFKTFDTL